MPGVRYGPDIADDAAHIQNSLVELLKLEKASKSGKLGKDNRKKLETNLRLAKQLFGVNESDIRKGKFRDLGVLAEYSDLGRNPRTGTKRTRSKLARNDAGRVFKKDMAREHADRMAGVKSSGTTGSRGLTGENTYLGRTAPKRYREARERAYRRARKGGVAYGRGGGIPKGTKVEMIPDKLDRMNVARTPSNTGLSYRPGTVRANLSVRPPLTKSMKDMAARTKRDQSKRATAVKGAGKGRAKSSVAKKATKPRNR
jgi:hypothetical protein